MSKESCQKELICMRLAIKKLDAVAEQLEFYCSMSELNYAGGADVDLKEVEEMTAKAEAISRQAEKMAMKLVS